MIHTRWFFLVFTMFASFNGFAFYYAKVVNDKAVIYADRSMLTPIGYLHHGKVAKTGEVLVGHGEIIPVFISGHIGYGHKQDFSIASEKRRYSIRKFRFLFRQQKNFSDL